MGKFKAISKEVNLKEFRNRSCTVCANRLSVDSYNGRIHGRFGPASGKILECKACDLLYFYDWNYQKNKYLIDRVILNNVGECITAFIDYSGKLKTHFGLENTSENKSFNIGIKLLDTSGYYNTHVYIGKTYSMPKKKIFKDIKGKAELYAVFS